MTKSYASFLAPYVVAAVATVAIAADAPPAAPTPPTPTPVDLEKVKATLTGEIRRRMETDGLPSVSIALVRGQDVVWAEAFGVTNAWSKTPATPDTIYSTGSTFKSVVATAVMQLVDQGRLSLDTPLSDVLKDCRIKQPSGAGPITIRHLLSHASGLPRGAFTVPVWDRRLPPSIDESALDVECSFAPGASSSYSNLGFGLLGRVIEKVTGEPFAEHMQKAIFDPLGMKDTTLLPSATTVERMALPYSRSGARSASPGAASSTAAAAAGLEPLRQVRFDVFPAGDVYTTARDMARFVAMQLNDGALGSTRVLSEASAKAMRTRPFPTAGYPQGWGLGLYVEEQGGVVFSHSGSVPGLVAQMRGDASARVGVYLLSNQDSGGAALESLARIAIRLLRGETVNLFDPALARRAPVPPRWADLVGSYLSSYGGPLRVHVADQSLRLEVAGRTAWLVPASPEKGVEKGVMPDAFTLRGDDVRDGMTVAFRRDAAGKVTAVDFGDGGAVVEAAPRLATDAATTMDVTKPPEGVLDGEWQGTAVFGGMRLEFTLRVRREGGPTGPASTIAGTVTLPAQGLRDSPVDHLLHHGNQVHFEHGAGAALALVDGVLDGDTLRGTLHRLSFVLPVEAYRVGSDAAKAAAARAATAAAAAKAAADAAQGTGTKSPFVGEWEGKLHVGAGTLTLRLHVAADDRATLDIPEQTVNRAPLDRVSRDGLKVHFELPSPIGLANFSGTISGDSIAGTLLQNGVSLPFELTRTPGR